MYRLLLPGLRFKRWLLVNLIGMTLFALGFALLLNPQWDFRARLWYAWVQISHREMPELTPVLLGLIFIIGGMVLAAHGTKHLIRAFTTLANPHTSGRQLIQAMLEQRYASPRLRIVGIGGGTGLSTLLRGLKAYPVDLTAIVTVSDDGGSSGRLRADMAIPPPGDIRNCLVALADAEPLMERLFQHRFTSESSALLGHPLGNLIIAGLWEMTGDFQDAIREVSRVLAVRGHVIPSADRALRLRATTEDGQVLEGETAISSHGGRIVSVSLDPPDITAVPEALQAIREADVIILGPGSVYSSLLPNVIIPGMAEALAASQAIKVFVCNVMTQPGESDDFTASRHLEVMLEHLPIDNPFHFALVNLQRPADDVLVVYAQKGQQFVEPDLARIRALGTVPIIGELLADLHLARHDPDKLARCLLKKIAEEANWPSVLRRNQE